MGGKISGQFQFRNQKRYHNSYIKKYVKERTGEDFSQGLFSGALRYLVVNDGNVVNPKKGYYQLAEEQEEKPFIKEVLSMFEEQIKEIEGMAQNINPLYIDSKQEKILRILRQDIEWRNEALKKLKNIKR